MTSAAGNTAKTGAKQPWALSWRADPVGAQIADGHYNRQKPGAAQFVPPGRCLVLLAEGPALWVTSWPFAQYVKHDWPGAWINSTFRREGGVVASEMIRMAVAATRARWPMVPALGMVSFVDPAKVRHKRDPGRCYRKAGFSLVGETKGGLLVWQMLPADMPPPVPALGMSEPLWEAGA